MLVVKTALLIVVDCGTGPVRSTTTSAALARVAPKNTAPAASAIAHAALRTRLLMGTFSFKGEFRLRAVRKNNGRPALALSPGNVRCPLQRIYQLTTLMDGLVYTHGVWFANCPIRPLL